jgi:two-component system, NtrC family, sensor kinase
MKKRSKAAIKPAKARPRKALKPKGRSVPKVDRASAPAGQETDVPRLTRELHEALEQQVATAEVLKVISRSAFDLQTVLDALVESAARLCAANRGVINQGDEEGYRVVASYGFSPELKQYAAEHPLRPHRGSLTGRAVAEGQSIHVADVLADPEYSEVGYLKFGYRTALAVPLLRERASIGVFVLTRNEVNPFTDKQIALVETFAAQTVIAIENARLLKELRQRTEEVEKSNAALSTTRRRNARTACLRCQPVVRHSASRMRPFSTRPADQ